MSGISLISMARNFYEVIFVLIYIYYILVPFHKMKVLEVLVIVINVDIKDTNQKALLSLIYIYLRIYSLIWSF